MKEAYSNLLLPTICDQLSLPIQGLAVVDPYVGSGTTAVSLAEISNFQPAEFYGAESNPFLHLVATAKFEALQNPPQDFDDFSGLVAATAVRSSTKLELECPGLSTLSRRDYISKNALEELLKLRQSIELHAPEASPEAVNLAKVCLGATVEPSTKLRRDGRALRFSPDKTPVRPAQEFLARTEAASEDLPVDPYPLTGEIKLGDARGDTLPSGASAAGLVLFSPPYPNNIDYTEIYKMELWLLGFVSSGDEFADQRRQTVRSHPSLKTSDPALLHPESHCSAVDDVIAPILDLVPNGDRYSASRRRTVDGYLRDMFSSLRYTYDRVVPDTPLVYVVGNSFHGSSSSGSFLFAADLLIAELAEIAGFEVERIKIARFPRRRSGSPFLRESVVFCRKRNGETRA
jgi:hypothetical protein